MKAKYYLRGMGIGIFITALIFGIALVFYRPKMSEDEIRREAAKLGMVNAADEALLSAANEADADASDTGEKVTVENIPGATDTEDGSGEDSGAGSDGNAEDADGSGDDASASSGEDGGSAAADGSDSDAGAADTKKDASADAGDETKPSTEYQGEQQKKAGSDSQTGTTGTSTGSAGLSASGNSSSSSSASGSSRSSSSSGSSTGSAGTSYGVGSSSGSSKTLTIRNGENSYTTAAHLYKDGLVDNASKFNHYLESNHYDVKIQAGTFTIPEGASYEEIMKIITRQ